MAKKIIGITVLLCLLSFIRAAELYAAVGCTLNDPDRDIRRIFPESTGYRTEFITIKERGGEDLAAEVEKKLGDEFEPVYETIDVPYAYYSVLKGKERIGTVHGVNQKGRYGGMQIILSTDNDGKIIDLYYQKISSPESGRFRDKNFTDKFKGLDMEDLEKADLENISATGEYEEIKDPTEKSREDFVYTIRGVKKNLILLEEFGVREEGQ